MSRTRPALIFLVELDFRVEIWPDLGHRRPKSLKFRRIRAEVGGCRPRSVEISQSWPNLDQAWPKWGHQAHHGHRCVQAPADGHRRMSKRVREFDLRSGRCVRHWRSLLAPSARRVIAHLLGRRGDDQHPFRGHGGGVGFEVYGASSGLERLNKKRLPRKGVGFQAATPERQVAFAQAVRVGADGPSGKS